MQIYFFAVTFPSVGQGFRITKVVYLHCIGEYCFHLYRENIDSGTNMDIWLKSIPKYLDYNYFDKGIAFQYMRFVL